MSRHEIRSALLLAYRTRERWKNTPTVGLQQITIDQINATIKEADLLVELLREESRLLENTQATDCGSHKGVNGTPETKSLDDRYDDLEGWK